MPTQAGQSSIQPPPPSGLACPKKHKVRCENKSSNTTNQASPSCGVTFSKDSTPIPQVDEINRLAKAWCELVFGFIEERNRTNSSVPFSPLQGKIDIGKG